MFQWLTGKRTAVVRVQTMQKAQKIMAICQRNNWKAIVGVEENQPENLSDVERLIKKIMPRRLERNDSCFCGSEKKFKRCCMIH